MHYDYSATGERLGQAKANGAGLTVPSQYRTFATDANGSVEEMEETSGDATPNSKFVYDPYGERETPAGSSEDSDLSETARENPFRFQGFYFDSGVKTYDMQARQYRSDTGRFLSGDRYESAGADLNLQADPLTQNRYAFAGGNPVNNIEFDGHLTDDQSQDGAHANKVRPNSQPGGAPVATTEKVKAPAPNSPSNAQVRQVFRKAGLKPPPLRQIAGARLALQRPLRLTPLSQLSPSRNARPRAPLTLKGAQTPKTSRLEEDVATALVFLGYGEEIRRGYGASTKLRASTLGRMLRTSNDPDVRSRAARALPTAGKRASGLVARLGRRVPELGIAIDYGANRFEGRSPVDSLARTGFAAGGGLLGGAGGSYACGSTAVATLGLGSAACPALVVGGAGAGGAAGTFTYDRLTAPYRDR